jgi:hypothetical protein
MPEETYIEDALTPEEAEQGYILLANVVQLQMQYSKFKLHLMFAKQKFIASRHFSLLKTYQTQPLLLIFNLMMVNLIFISLQVNMSMLVFQKQQKHVHIHLAQNRATV